MSELAQLLQDQGISPKSYRTGSEHRLECPKCHGGSTHEKSLSLTIDNDGGAVWVCFRACGWKGNIPSKRNILNFRQKAYIQPQEHMDQDVASWVTEYFQARKIGQDTLDELGIYSAFHYMPEIEERIECIVFPYRQNGILQRRKYRGFQIREGNAPILERIERKFHAQDKDSAPALMNFDAINPELVVFCEGETDLCAIYESGYSSVITLPDGSPSLNKEGKPINLQDQRFLPLHLNKKRLDEVKIFILAGDKDEVGQRYMGAIEDILGPRRCKFVTWPSGCKDAGETLMKHGKEAVQKAIEAAQFSSKVGVVKTTFDGVIERMSEMDIPGLSLGIDSLDGVLRLPAHGGMVLLTGQPGRGKTSFTNWLMAQSILKYNWNWVAYAAEGYGGEGATINLMKTLAYLKLSHIPHTRLGDNELEQAYQIATKKCDFLDTKKDVNKRIETILANIDWMREFKPVNGVLIDPWNAVDVNNERKAFREDEHLNQILGTVNDWSHDTNTMVLICVHPRTLRAGKDGKVAEISGYDLAGGAAFFNKTDAGYTISRTEDDHMKINNWKARYNNWSKLGSAELLYDWKTGLVSDL